MSKLIPTLLLTDILTAIEKIGTYTEGLDFDSFLADTRTVEAVERNFEIIGEAANQFSKEFQEANSHIPWHSVVSFRNRLIHSYFGVDYQIIWQVMQVSLPDLKNHFSKLSEASNDEQSKSEL